MAGLHIYSHVKKILLYFSNNQRLLFEIYFNVNVSHNKFILFIFIFIYLYDLPFSLITINTEHRNMPLNDAVALVGRSFEEYVDTLREKAKAATATTSSSDSSTRATTTASTLTEGFLAASSNVAYLLNLLADNQALTVPELEDVIQYLKQRRSKMMDAEERQQAFNGLYDHCIQHAMHPYLL